MSDIYLQITETPTVVTLSAPVVASVMVNTVTVANVVSVNVVTMPAITVQAVAPSVTTVAGTVTISSLPAISGTVTANVLGKGIDGFVQLFTANDGAGRTYDGGGAVAVGFNDNINNSFRHVSTDKPFPIQGTVTISSLPAISGAVEVNEVQSVLRIYDGEGNIFGIDRNFPISGEVDVNSLPSIVGTVTANIGNSITVGSLPVQLSTTTIRGTAWLNVTLSSATTIGATVPSYGNLCGGSDGTNFRAISVDTSGRTVVTGSVSVASTTVTIGAGTARIGSVTASIFGLDILGGGSQVMPSLSSMSETFSNQSSGYTLITKISSSSGNPINPLSDTELRATAVTIAGTVTANNPNGALTTRFGSVTTANTSQITTAVTNTSRKYLLAQNISTGTVTIGIGFSPTTTQGIQLTAGAGLTFDSFVPTGAVYWLGATTGAAYTILEG
jgi:hypothetical protein